MTPLQRTRLSKAVTSLNEILAEIDASDGSAVIIRPIASYGVGTPRVEVEITTGRELYS